MGWNINITTEKEISENEINSAISKLPENLSRGAGKQEWGWSLAVDVRLRRPKEIGLSGSYGVSGKIAEHFSKTLAEILESQGIRCKIGELY